ncbi:hypothetical protein F2P81_018570 [Scophthalmus maximus]|uniref:Endonuclease/exonuclease/phosphatase domain-containing protein n=1 Tax=Scophthalmus maximus TaxID=52904 RepID=A0A6A4SAQ7_SCOMX|nr:hypothetical protein F2P81_018570 [Scophthalmus maximus]
MEIKNLVCLNDGSGTRIDARTRVETSIDLTLVSDTLASTCTWEVITNTTIGSDHYPIMVDIGIEYESEVTRVETFFFFNSADRDKFKKITEQEMGKILVNENVNEVNEYVCKAILEAAEKSIKKKNSRHNIKIVPWWTKECSKAMKARNKAFKIIKRNSSFQNVIEYKRVPARVRKIIKDAKKEYWRRFCNTVGKETEIGKVWRMIKRMKGGKQERGYPVLSEGGIITVKDEEKAEMLAKTFVKIHSEDNIGGEGKRGREDTLVGNEGILKEEEDIDNLTNKPFSVTELNRALRKTLMSAPGKDQINYIMLNHLGESAKEKIL